MDFKLASADSATPGLELDIRRAAVTLFLFLVGFYLCILLNSVLLAYKGQTFFTDPDVYWHVAVGRSIWQSATLPHFDELSHTFRGHPWIAKEWLGQLFLFFAYALAGWRGVALITASIIALTYGLLFVVLARSMRLTVAAGGATVALIFSAGHFTARPQIFVDPLIIIWVASLVRSIETRTAPNWLLLPVLVLWANLHASFSFGPGIAALLAAEAFFDSPADLRFRTARRWGFFLAAALVAACVTPYGYQPILMTLRVFVGNDTLQYIQEWRPATPGVLDINGLIVFGLLFLALYYGVKLRFWRLILILGLVYMMLAHVRFGSLFAIVAPLLLATPLTAQFPQLSLRTQIETDPQSFGLMAQVSRYLVLGIGVLSLGVVSLVIAKRPAIAPNSEITPAGAVDYIQNDHLVGNIYNPQRFGGYLIFRGIRTFVDGRNDQLFSGGFTTRLYNVVDRHPSQFPDYLTEFDVSIALVTPNSLEAQELAHSANWERVYSDDVSVLFKKSGSVQGDAQTVR